MSNYQQEWMLKSYDWDESLRHRVERKCGNCSFRLPKNMMELREASRKLKLFLTSFHEACQKQASAIILMIDQKSGEYVAGIHIDADGKEILEVSRHLDWPEFDTAKSAFQKWKEEVGAEEYKRKEEVA